MKPIVFFTENDEGFRKILQRELPKHFSKGEKVAVKLHMGEPGNKTHLKPDFVKIVTDELKKIGVKPFLFDSPVKYASRRNTPEGYFEAAKEKGFGRLGVPIVVSNQSIKAKGEFLEYEVCKPLVEADGVLVLSHVKGHICSGFGGAIKNLGMGALTKESKAAIHEGGKPKLVGECTMCKECEKSCPTDNIWYKNNKPSFDRNWCCGCSNCAIICPAKAITTPTGATFDRLLSEGAAIALRNFKKSYFINVMRDMTELCDCAANPGPVVMDDVGIALSNDIVAVEKASQDLIVKKAGKDIFKDVHKKSPLYHITEMHKLGMGELEYELSAEQ